MEDDVVRLRLEGRIDAYWSDHLSNVIAGELSKGNYFIRLDMAGVNYISSAGIRIFVNYYKKIKDLNGVFAIENLSDQVAEIFRMAGLLKVLTATSEKTVKTSQRKKEIISLEKFSCSYSAETADGMLDCNIIAGPEIMRHNKEITIYDEQFDRGRYGVGLGAIGDDFADCRNRFGEFIAVDGAAAYLPTDGTEKPDYNIKTGQLIPSLQVAYGLTFGGDFRYLVQFQAHRDMVGVTLENFFSELLNILSIRNAGIVMVAESAGLVGAALRRSPFVKTDNLFSFPGVRDNVNFTTERDHVHKMAVITGVICRDKEDMNDILRPISQNSDIYTHLHAGIFPFVPLKKDIKDISELTDELFRNHELETILHLMGDDREVVGIGQSEVVQGYCRIGEIGEIRKS
jgi:anti-anti-sigma factor